MEVSEHFKSEEFRCRCGECEWSEEFVPPPRLIGVLEDVREYFGVPIRVTSCKRCLQHNRSIGSKDTSQHVKGTAVDIQVNGVSPTLVYEYLDSVYRHKVSIGLYKTFVHIDVRRPGGARW